jgi:hypothetical protein
MQKMCLLWQIKVSWDVMVLGVINSEYKSTFLKNGENCSLCHTIPHSRMPIFNKSNATISLCSHDVHKLILHYVHQTTELTVTQIITMFRS